MKPLLSVLALLAIWYLSPATPQASMGIALGGLAALLLCTTVAPKAK